MGDMRSFKTRPIADVCEVERAKAGKQYPAGSCFVALSATNDAVNQLRETAEIETRYAVLVPRDGVDPRYLKVVLDRAFPRFLESHRTGVNLKFDEVFSLYIEWHESEQMRAQVVKTCQIADELADLESKTISGLKELKQYGLIRMFL